MITSSYHTVEKSESGVSPLFQEGFEAGLEIDRVPSRSDRDFPIDAASRHAGLSADPAERDPHLREEAEDL